MPAVAGETLGLVLLTIIFLSVLPVLDKEAQFCGGAQRTMFP